MPGSNGGGWLRPQYWFGGSFGKNRRTVFLKAVSLFALVGACSAQATLSAVPAFTDRLQPEIDGGSCIGPFIADAPVTAATEYSSSQSGLGTAQSVRDSHDPQRIASYMQLHNPQSQGDFELMLIAFSGLDPADIGTFYSRNAKMMLGFSLAVQAHQDWYESLVAQLTNKVGNTVKVLRSQPEVAFTQDQLGAMRTAFVAADGMFANGELLLAYPDRLERNEEVTQQYFNLSNGMAGIVGSDNTSWPTVAVWASDLVGRNVFGTDLMMLSEDTGGNPRYWLSVGNSQLISDIGPGFQYFVETFGNGQNRTLGFDSWWNNFLVAFSGRNISYVDGSGDPDLHMENAFKAYYAAMQIHDEEASVTDPVQHAALDMQRQQLALFANVLAAMQEQKIIQPVLANGMCMLGVVNLDGVASFGINYILADTAGTGEFVLPTWLNLANTPDRVTLSQSFTLVDGDTVSMSNYLCSMLNGLDAPANGRDECTPADSGTAHWEDYGERMGFIYELFSDYDRYAPIYDDPRQVFGTRAVPLNNAPVIEIRQILEMPGS